MAFLFPAVGTNITYILFDICIIFSSILCSSTSPDSNPYTTANLKAVLKLITRVTFRVPTIIYTTPRCFSYNIHSSK